MQRPKTNCNISVDIIVFDPENRKFLTCYPMINTHKL